VTGARVRRVSRRGLVASSAAGAVALAAGKGAVPAAAMVATPVASPVSAVETGAIQFHAGFLWGTASAAHQVEGAVTQDGRGPSIWDTFSHTPGKTFNGDTGDIACDQYNRYEADFDLMAELGFPAYRFSIAWPRIQPTGEGPVNQLGLDHYQRLVDALLERGISPVVTIYHWDLPQALEDRGGWTARETADRYADYAAIVYEALADRVPHFLCLNEPSSQALIGYGLGEIAPGRTSRSDALHATHYQLLGQGLAVQAMRAHQRPEAKIGTTLALWDVQPASERPADVEAAQLFDGDWNRMYLDPIFTGHYPADMLANYAETIDLSFIRDEDLATIATPLDFLGVNYYTNRVVAADAQSPSGYTVVTPIAPPLRTTPTGVNPPSGGVSSVGWLYWPQGMTDVLLRVRNEYTSIPLYITETGWAWDDYVDPAGQVKDPERIACLDGYLRAAHAAMAQGVDLRGVIIWCFQDNFASSMGYAKRFGLVWTDFATQQRIPKQSALWYRDVIAANGLAAAD
jgi:beta-glucosidase